MKYKKYPSYKDSGVEWLGEIPEHWELSKVSHNFTAKKGIKASLYTKEYCAEIIGEYPVYSGQTENNGVLARINEFEFDSGMEGYLFSTTVGAKAMTLSHLRGKFSLSQNCMIIKSLKDRNTINTRFYFYHKQPLFKFERGLIPEYMQASFRMEDLYQFKICLPSIQEQQQIANFLDNATAKIDTLIEKQTKLIMILKEKRQAVISYAVTKGINPNVKIKDSGVEWLGDIPEHWDINKLRYVFRFSTGLSITRENLQYKGIPCVSYGEVHSKYGFEVSVEKNVLKCVDESYLISSKNSLISKGDFIFADTSEDLEGAGNFTHLAGDRQVFAGYHTVIARLISQDNYYRYIAYLLDSQSFRKQIKLAVKGVKVFSITQAILKNCISWIPPLEEQQQIANYLDDKTSKMDKLIKKATKSIKLLKEKRTALISAAVTGKIDVKEVS